MREFVFEMDFSKRFLAEIILGCKNYSWTQKLDYERITLQCRACFETWHILRKIERRGGNNANQPGGMAPMKIIN